MGVCRAVIEIPIKSPESVSSQYVTSWRGDAGIGAVGSEDATVGVLILPSPAEGSLKVVPAFVASSHVEVDAAAGNVEIGRLQHELPAVGQDVDADLDAVCVLRDVTDADAADSAERGTFECGGRPGFGARSRNACVRIWLADSRPVIV